MKLRAILTSTTLACMTAAASPASSAAEFEWRMATAVAEGSYFYNEFVLRFVDLAKTLTDGRVQITPYGAGVIVPAFKVYDAVAEGLVETGHSSPGYLVNKDPTNGIVAAFPGGMGAEAMLHWMYAGGGGDLWVQFREQTMGLHPLFVGMHGSEIYAHARKPLRVAEDLKGLKHRTGGPPGQILKDYFGGNAMAAPQAEIYGLLERGAIDSAEFATPAANVSDGYYEIARYVIVPGIHTPSSPWELVISKARWDALPQDIRHKLELAAQLTTLQSLLKVGVDDLAAMQKIRDNKNEIVTLDDALIQAYRTSGRDWAHKKAAEQKGQGSPWMERILESYQGFQERWNANAVYRVKDE